MSTATSVENFDINHIHLSDIDPAQQNITPGLYTLQLTKAELVNFTYKNGPRTGEQGLLIGLKFVVTDDANFSGRRVSETIFPSSAASLKPLRKIMDATGIPQNQGEAMGDYLTRLSSERPKMRIFIKEVEDVDRNGNARSLDYQGNTAKVNKLNLWEVLPA